MSPSQWPVKYVLTLKDGSTATAIVEGDEKAQRYIEKFVLRMFEECNRDHDRLELKSLWWERDG